MRSGHLLFSAVQFLFTTLILLLGGFFIGLHYAPHLGLTIGQFFIGHSEAFIPIGLSILGCGSLLLIGFYAMNRGAYFRFQIPAKDAVIEAAVFRSCIKKYWREQFPQEDLSTDVILHADKKIEISVELPPLDAEDHQKFLENVESDLRSLLAKSLGYKSDFLLTVIVR